MRQLLIALILFSASLSCAQSAGKVDRLVPAGFIARGPSTSQAKPADPVLWNDILRTNDAGRMHIGLDDGSMLSLGAHSELRVVKHDPDSNQTLIEMLYGKARANVQPIHKQGGSFQVRTPTAVIGVLGTQVEIETVSPSTTLSGDIVAQLPVQRRNVSDLADLVPGTMPNGDPQQPATIADFPLDATIVRSLDHMVGVRSIEPKLTKVVFLLPGQYTIVRRGLEPTDPQFGDPPQHAGQAPPATMPNGQPCPSFVDPRDFEKRFPQGLQPSYEITGRGTSTGQVFDVRIKNPSGCPLNVQIPAGSVLQPTGYVGRVVKGILLSDGMPPLKDYQVMIAEGGFGEIPFAPAANPAAGNLFFFLPADEGEQEFTLRGYCLELHKLAPHAKTRYKFADTADEQRLSGPNLKILETANKLFFTGQDNPPFARLDDLVQWSLWASREGMTDAKKFQEEYVGLVKKNYENQNKKFDGKTKQQAEEIAQKFWPYVQKVVEAAK